MSHLRNAIVLRFLGFLFMAAVVTVPTLGEIFFFAKVTLWLLGAAFLFGGAFYLFWIYQKIKNLMLLPAQNVWVIFEIEDISIGGGDFSLISAFISFAPRKLSRAQFIAGADLILSLGFNSIPARIFRQGQVIPCQLFSETNEPKLLVDPANFVAIVARNLSKPGVSDSSS